MNSLFLVMEYFVSDCRKHNNIRNLLEIPAPGHLSQNKGAIPQIACIPRLQRRTVGFLVGKSLRKLIPAREKYKSANMSDHFKESIH